MSATRYDERDAHTLVCLQSNREIPQQAQECVCPPRLPRTFRPDYELEGPYEGGPPYPMLYRVLCWIVCAVLSVSAVCFIAGALLRHFNKV